MTDFLEKVKLTIQQKLDMSLDEIIIIEQTNQIIDQINNEINELNSTLYSGKIRNTKEVEALEIEIKNKTTSLESYESKKNQVKRKR